MTRTSTFRKQKATVSRSQLNITQDTITEDITGRSPCPGLNALANQGYIPRDGRNIDPAQLAEAMLEVMNLDIAPFQTEIDTTLAHSTTGNSSTFNLEDSNVHNDIEIDGSLSRKDLYFGDNIHFDESIWAQSSSKFEGDIITIRTAAYSRRYRTSMAEAMVSAYDLLLSVKPAAATQELRRRMGVDRSLCAIVGINLTSVLNSI